MEPNVWPDVTEAKLYVVGLKSVTQELYVESPEEQGLYEDEPQEYILRVFQTMEEAERYKAALDTYCGLDLKIYHADLGLIFGRYTKLNERVTKASGLPLKLELCTMPEDGWAKNIMTLKSQIEELH